MIIKKYLHSCILLEKDGKRLLIDPGAFSFIEKKVTPKEIGPVDIILLTHKHLDHYHPDAIKELVSLRPAKILANHEIADLLKNEGLACTVLEEGKTSKEAGFTIHALHAPHEPIPAECPHNLAFVIDGKILHPGDSFRANNSCEVLLLPIAGPWCRLVDALDYAKKLQPRLCIPIHDGIIKEFMLERMYSMCSAKLKESGIEFKPLALHDKMHI